MCWLLPLGGALKFAMIASQRRKGLELNTEKILHILADGDFHSGEELGAALGVSRAAVWKQLQKLESLSVELESQKGRGYRIVGGLSLLSREQVLACSTEASRPFVASMDILGEVASTNQLALARIAEGGAHGYCCAAELQSSGRGRRGRQWVSPFARSVYFSMVWEFHSGASALEGLSLCVGVAVARALRGAGVDGVALKWPNDILRDGRKLAGILLEMQGDPAGVCQVVIGVGINARMSGADTSAITQPWADLRGCAIADDRSRLLALVLNALVDVLNEYSSGGFPPFREEWQLLDAYRGREVMVQLGEAWVRGTAEGVDQGGGLQVRTDTGLRTFHGGEVSLRSAG